MGQGSGSFMETIRSVRDAESKAVGIKEEARKKSGDILVSIKRESEELRLEGEKDALKRKDSLISQGKKNTEKEALRLVSAAEKKAQSIKEKKPGAEMSSFLMGVFLKSFQ